MEEKILLARAVEVALDGMKKGGGPFGAVIVRNGVKISESFNRVVLDNDPTAHAEIVAIRKASSILKTHDLSDCILFTSCEPCPMCLGAIYWSGIRKVYYSCDRFDAEYAGFSDRVIYDELGLEPSERKITFIKMDCGGEKVFETWNGLENKHMY
jgi:tRNA(Arg) A34 adenosine deaminase TadA